MVRYTPYSLLKLFNHFNSKKQQQLKLKRREEYCCAPVSVLSNLISGRTVRDISRANCKFDTKKYAKILP